MANVLRLVALHFLVLVLILSSQKTAGCLETCSAIGLDDSNIIPDSSFTASSEYSASYAPHKARFSSNRCWEAKDKNNAGDYLQIDFGKVFVICAVATKGNAKRASGEYTKQYKISISSDGNLWIPYSENNNSPKLLSGNTDHVTAVKNDLVIPVLAKLIRFTPTQYNGYKALRVEVYGIDAKDFSCSSLPVGVASVAKIPDNSMTSSSQYSSSTPASKGRLGYTAGSSWCAARSDSSPYLQVKLGSPYIICGVATQGEHTSDNLVQAYQIQTSTDGSTFTDYKHNNVIQSFVGNTDQDTIVKNPLYEGSVSEFVRIKAKSNRGITSCLRTELYGVQQHTVCSKMSIGVSYANLVPDHRFTASSYYDSSYIASNARLRTNEAWEPETSNQVGDWLQIDLGSVVYVCAVATQGSGYSQYDEYVKKYKLRVSLDNVNWEYYKENHADKEFAGNTDRTTIVTNTLSTPTKTKFLRFYPTEFNSWAAMRVDVYGVPSTCNSSFGLEKGGPIGASKITSSSQSDSAASFSRLYGSASWCSNVQANTEYLQVDLDKMVTLTGIATQGDRTMDKWVKTYTLKYSIDGNTWNEYREGQPYVKVFQGNFDNSSIVVRWFTHPVTVRYVRVFPQTWNTGICMRVELFGCNCPSLPKIKELSNKILSASPSGRVDLECNVQEPLIQYIHWFSGITDVTHLSGGITRTASSVQSVLRVNFTSGDSVFNDYKCSNSSALSPLIACRRNVVCRAKYVKANGNADSLKSAQVFVNLEKPSALHSPSVGSISSMSVTVSWTQPALKPSQANITSYAIKYWHKSTTKVVIAASQDRSKSISGLSACTEYNVSITSYSILGPGPCSDVKTFMTDSAEIPRSPKNLKVLEMSKTSAKLKWSKPQLLLKPVEKYIVTYRWWKTYAFNWPNSITSAEKEYYKPPSSQDVTLTLTGLYPATRYIFTVSAVVECGRGNNSNDATGDTEIAAPPAPSGGTVNKITSSVANITLWPISAINGKINFYLVYVRGVKDDNKRAQESSNLRCEEIAQDAAKLSPNTKIFTIGDRKQYGQFKNKELEKGISYQVFQCGVTETMYGGMTKIAEGTVPENKDNEAVRQPQEKNNCTTERYLYIAFAVIAAIQLFVIVLLLVYKRHPKHRVKKQSSTKSNQEETSQQENSDYENVTEIDEPQEDIPLSHITATDDQEYEYIEPPPQEARKTSRPITSKSPSYSRKLPSPPQGEVKKSSYPPKHSTRSSSNADTSTSSGMVSRGMCQQLELNQQGQDCRYEEFNKNSIAKTPSSRKKKLVDRPGGSSTTQDDASNSIYQNITISGSSAKDVKI